MQAVSSAGLPSANAADESELGDETLLSLLVVQPTGATPAAKTAERERLSTSASVMRGTSEACSHSPCATGPTGVRFYSTATQSPRRTENS